MKCLWVFNVANYPCRLLNTSSLQQMIPVTDYVKISRTLVLSISSVLLD